MNSNRKFPSRVLHKLALSFLLSAMALPAVTRAECPADWVQINAREVGDSVQLHAANSRDVPITIALQVWTRHMTADRRKTVTETVRPKESQLFIVLRKNDDGKRPRFGFDCDWTIGSIDAIHDDDLLYQLPYETGKSYRVLQGYGSRLSHTGREQYTIDFNMHQGTPVHAARGGIVARTEESHSRGCWKSGCGKYANFIVILHDDWTTGEYYHLQKNGVLVEVGDRVLAGQKIGLSGDTGNSTMPHLHFGVYRAAQSGKYQSIPVQFSSIDGIVRKPRRGGLYQAISTQSSARSQSESDVNGRSL